MTSCTRQPSLGWERRHIAVEVDPAEVDNLAEGSLAGVAGLVGDGIPEEAVPEEAVPVSQYRRLAGVKKHMLIDERVKRPT